MPNIHEILKQYWNYDAFRPLQEDIVQSVINGKDTLALLPTGGGKSICFQVPGMYFEGLTIVVSPLIALMKDQVTNLEKVGIAATYINSSLSPWQIDMRLQAAMDGKYKFLYIAPERIRSAMFLQRLPQMKVSLLVVDEAHCISQWGYDFRPSYLDINHIRKICKDIPTIALTASAIPAVRADIIDKLQLKKVAVFEKSFRRENLRYFVLKEENVVGRIIEIAKRSAGTGIVYVRTRKATEIIAQTLVENGISALAYHGGMIHSDRDKIQQQWIQNQHRIIVATNAFGMGIDKPDVRFVLHYQLPADLESYYQEAGRGGRDGKTALAIAFDNGADKLEIQRWVATKYPTWDEMQSCYEALCRHFKIANEGDINVTYNFDIQAFSQENNISPRVLHNVITVLHREMFVFFNEEKEDYGYIQSMCSPDDWINFKQKNPKAILITDMILRNMGGAIYSREVPFLPQTWATALSWELADLEKQLKRLAQLNLIAYTPPTGMPTLTFLKNSQSLTQNSMNWGKYLFLQRQAAFRLKELLHYVENTETCRSILIQQYFGEETAEKCGKCDVCIGRHKTQVNDTDFEILQKEIQLFLTKNPETSYRDTLQLVQKGSPSQKEEVLRYLIDKGIVISDKLTRLKVK